MCRGALNEIGARTVRTKVGDFKGRHASRLGYHPATRLEAGDRGFAAAMQDNLGARRGQPPRGCPANAIRWSRR